MGRMTCYALPVVGLAIVCLLPLAAVGQEASQFDNEMTMGVGYQSSSSAMFGRYTGSVSKGMSAFGSFRVNQRDAWDSGKAGYFRAEGDGIEVDRRQLSPAASGSMEIGEQGKWGAQVEYQGIPSTSAGGR